MPRGVKGDKSGERLRKGLSYLLSRDQRAARINSIPNSVNTSEPHWWAITKLARELRLQGTSSVIEATFVCGGRADLYLPEMGIIIEVLESETLAQFESKVNKHYSGYPFRVSYVYAAEVLSEPDPNKVLQKVFLRAKVYK